MLKKVCSILISVLTFSVIYIAYGMEEKNPVSNAGLNETILDILDMEEEYSKLRFNGESTIYLSLSSSEEDKNKGETETMCNKSVTIIKDYHDASNIEKPFDVQEVVAEPTYSFEWYYSRAQETLSQAGAYANDLKNRLVKALDQQQPR